MISSTRDVLRGRGRIAMGPSVENFSCSHCGGDQGTVLFDTLVPESRDYDVARCSSCSLVAIHPMPDAALVPGFYESEYYGEENAKFGPVTEALVGMFRHARIRTLRRAGVRRGNVLDIGCARGLFLRVLQRQGFEPYGTELSELSARGARKRIGSDRVRVGSLSDCEFETGSFAAITAWQVFEHLTTPGAVLRECHRVLEPDGVLVLAVPNIDSWQARISGADWFHLDVPRHIFHYSPATLTALLESHGFRTEQVTHHNLEQNPFGLLQSALHRIGRPFCGLYDLLRGEKGRPSRTPVFKRCVFLALYAIAFPAAVLISSFWALAGSGATFTIQARRVD